jgi:uncharacterized protein YkwD
MVVAIAVAVAISPPVSRRLGYTPPFAVSRLFEATETATGVSLFPGAPAITLTHQALYPHGDPWKAWLADGRTCPGGERTDIAAALQMEAMLCLLNFARARQRLRPLALSRLLSTSAAAKASDIARCGRFEHAACGKEPNRAAVDLGYRGSFGENLYMAEGRLVAPRVAVDRWLNSPEHRENLFRSEWRTTGIARLSNADVDRVQGGVVWVNQFGDL